jgi:hypothetical protein
MGQVSARAPVVSSKRNPLTPFTTCYNIDFAGCTGGDGNVFTIVETNDVRLFSRRNFLDISLGLRSIRHQISPMDEHQALSG